MPAMPWRLWCLHCLHHCGTAYSTVVLLAMPARGVVRSMLALPAGVWRSCTAYRAVMPALPTGLRCLHCLHGCDAYNACEGMVPVLPAAL
jgi:hypothetical protein